VTILSIAGVDRTTYLDNAPGGLTVEYALQQRPALRGRLKDRSGAWRPGIRDVVTLEVDGVRLFGGLIATTDETDWGDYKGNLINFEAADYAHYADRVLVNGITYGPTLRDHVDQIIGRLSQYGITRDPAMAPGPNLGAQGWPFKYVSETFDTLAALAEYVWAIDPYGVLKMAPPATTPATAPLTADNATINQIAGAHDLTLYVNTIWLQYGGTGTREYTDTWHGDGTTREFIMTNHVAIAPTTVTVNSVVKPVGAYGVDDMEWTFKPRDPVPNYRGGLFQRASDPVLTAADTLVATYTAEFPGDAHAVDDAGVAEYGEIAIVEQRDDIYDRANAQQWVDARLRERGGDARMFRVVTHAAGYKPGQIVPINVPERALNTDCLIQVARIVYDGTKYDGSGYWRTELEVVEGRQSAETWIRYFKDLNVQNTGAASSSSSAGGPLPDGGGGGGGGNTIINGALSPIYFGGDRRVAYTGSTNWVEIPGFVDVLIDPAWDQLTVRCQSWVRNAAHTVNVRLVALTAGGVEVGRGTATNATDPLAGPAFQQFTATLDPAWQYYRLELQTNLASAEAFVAGCVATVTPAGAELRQVA
jgi:hypothetical protein